MQALMEKLYQQTDLNQAEVFEQFSQVIQGKMSDIDLTALLVALKIKGEKPQEVAGAAQALRQEATPFTKPEYITADSCGTGGSGKHTLNISTLVAFIAAVAGLKMVKHGNRSISSQCGSADVLERVGVKIDMSPQLAKQCLDELDVTFLFAPQYHTGVKHVMPVRNALKTRTIFNLLGPLINPAQPEIQLMGVYSPEHCYTAAESLRLSGCKRAMVVHSCGCDEITLAGKTHVAQLKDNKITLLELSPEDFGLNTVPLDAMIGRSPQQNTEEFCQLLQGQSSGAIIDIVAANAGALLYLAEISDTLIAGVKKAKTIISSGDAYHKLLALKALSQSS
jgi:anthranilate phosphoribosyltransferase